jgi:protein ImuA
VGLLREAIARIEGGRVAPLARPGGPVALGGRAGERGLMLDRVLRGGLGRGALHEVVAARPGDAGAACGFALALAARFAAAHHGAARAAIVWILEDAAGRESGAPYAPGLAAHGLDPARLLVVRTATAADTLWAMEEALKCRAPAAVVADLWRSKTYDLVASRRLVLAAGRNKPAGILVPAGAAGGADALSSSARTRFEVAAMPSPRLASAGHRLPLPGRAAWAVRIARIRAGPGSGASDGLVGFDWEKFWPLVWNHAEARFCDALPLSPPALSGDRSTAAAAHGQHAA